MLTSLHSYIAVSASICHIIQEKYVSYQLMIAVAFLIFAVAEALRSQLLFKPTATPADKYVEVFSSFTLIGLTQPLVLFSSMYLAATLLPDAEDALVSYPVLVLFGLLLVCDDMVQYWWHRASHTFPFLYGLHRAHHNGEYMSIRIVYRNNIFYYAMMPSLWISGLLIHMGVGHVYVVYIVIKMSVIFGAHSNVRWDEPLYKIKALSPLMWLIERTISTPATHAAHHGKYASDAATHYKGNFGNLLFFWDVLFGTARITRTYPDTYGVENLAPMSAKAQISWPLLQDATSPTQEVAADNGSLGIPEAAE